MAEELSKQKELSDRRRIASSNLVVAQATYEQVRDEFVVFLDTNKDSVQQLKGHAKHKMVKTGEGWKRQACDEVVIAEDYVVHGVSLTGDDNWTVEIFRPNLEDFTHYLVSADDLYFATPEEVETTRQEHAAVMEYAAAASGLGEVALRSSIVESTGPS
ncbi:MAG TPA: hypothetical protein VIH90_00570 [Candidatus Saccharimonadales bacterium]